MSYYCICYNMSYCVVLCHFKLIHIMSNYVYLCYLCYVLHVPNSADIPKSDLKLYCVDTCPKGCTPFWKDSLNVNVCPHCTSCRWRHCSITCVDEEGGLICEHKRKPARNFYYLSVRDRIKKLLRSHLKKLFHYESIRYKSTNDDFVEDIFDSDTYKHFKSLVPRDGQLIFLQVCWDGADMFNYSGKSMWPLCYSIMNFPPCLRDKPHIGMFMSNYV